MHVPEASNVGTHSVRSATNLRGGLDLDAPSWEIPEEGPQHPREGWAGYRQEGQGQEGAVGSRQKGN